MVSLSFGIPRRIPRRTFDGTCLFCARSFATHPVIEGVQSSVYVSTTAELEHLVSSIKGAPVLAIDTEFLREKTYYPKLCLVQLATEDVEAIVDPLVVGDMSPLAAILTDGNTVKVLHAGVQDVETLLRAVDVTPHPIFDTQVAASTLGHNHQVGYGALVQELCDTTLPKADSLTDWSRRPLTPTQLEYAIDDVRYLPRMYREMYAQLEHLGRLPWVQPEFEHLEDPASYGCEPEESWRKLKRVSSLSAKQRAVAQAVAAWREKEAMRRDIPRRWVLADELVVEIARRMPKTPDDILELRGISERMNLRVIREIVVCVEGAVRSDPATWPHQGRTHAKGPESEAAIDMMTTLVHLRAREQNVSSSLLASHEDIVSLSRGEREGVGVLEGWRRKLIGDELLSLLAGGVSLSMDDGHLKVTSGFQLS
jgi:ribonuclease D